jgi:hypothetical protein
VQLAYQGANLMVIISVNYLRGLLCRHLLQMSCSQLVLLPASTNGATSVLWHAGQFSFFVICGFSLFMLSTYSIGILYWFVKQNRTSIWTFFTR